MLLGQARGLTSPLFWAGPHSKILVYKIYVVKFVGILNPNTILAPNVLNSQGVSFFICSLKVITIFTTITYIL